MQTPYGYSPYYSYLPPETPLQKEKNRLRKEGNAIGVLMLLLIATSQLAYPLVSFLLQLFGLLPHGATKMQYLGLDNTTFMLVYSGIYTIAMGLPTLLVCGVGRRRFSPLSPTKPQPAPVTFLSILGGVGVCMAANILANIFAFIFTDLGINVPDPPQMMENTGTSLLLNLFVIAVLPALLEELMFRGCVLRLLRPYGNFFAILMSSLLFGLMHGNLRQIPFATMVGFCLGFLYIATDNIWIPIGVHFCNNAFSVLMEYTAFQLPEGKVDFFYGFAIYGLAAFGLMAAVLLLVRNGRHLRPQPRRSLIPGISRVVTLFKAPPFLISVILFVLIMILGM